MSLGETVLCVLVAVTATSVSILGVFISNPGDVQLGENELGGVVGVPESSGLSETNPFVPVPDGLKPPAPLSPSATIEDISPDNSDFDAADPDAASGGRVNGLASVAGNNDVFFAASEWGGIHKTEDGGLTWDVLDGHTPMATWDVEVDPNDADNVYATSFFDGRSNPSSGIQVSKDGGTTWTHPSTAYPDPALEGTTDDNTPQVGFDCANANDRTEPSAFGIGIRPDAAENVFVGSNCGMAHSSDAGVTWEFLDPNPSDGVNNAARVWDVVVQPASPGFPNGIVDICGDEGHFRSMDGGSTYVASGGLLPTGRCSITVSPDESYVLFVAASDNDLYESDDAGATWTDLGIIDPIKGPQGRVPFVVTNQRSDSSGSDMFDVWTGDVSLYRVSCVTPTPTAMGGANRCPGSAKPLPAGWFGPFTRCRDPDGNGCAHDDVGDIVFDTEVSVDACPMIFSSDGGVYYNMDLGADCQDPDWEQPNVTPHALWIYGMAGVDLPGDDNEAIYFVLQDNGVWGTTNAGAATPTWHNEKGIDGFDVGADQDTVLYTRGAFGARVFRLFLATSGMYGETEINTYPADGLVTAFRFGESIDTYGDKKYVVLMNDCTPKSTAFDGIDNDMDGEVDEADENNGCSNVNGGDGGVYITEDITAGTIVWTELGNSTEPPSNNFGEVQVAVDGGGVPTFYVQAGGGDRRTGGSLWKFTGTDPSGTWQRIDNNDGLSGGFNVFAVDPGNPDRLYASNLASGGPQIVRSNDGGATWDADPGLTSLMGGDGYFVNPTLRGPPGFKGSPQPCMLAFDPENENIIVAGGYNSGVFISDDDGRNWRLLTDPRTSDISGIPHLPRPFFVHFDHEPSGKVRIYIGTQGRGVWRITLEGVDGEILSKTIVDPPTEVLMGEDVELTVRDEVVNNGPVGPANFKVIFNAEPPAGAVVVGLDRIEVPSNLAVGVVTVVEVTFMVQCLEPSHHTFSFKNDIVPTDLGVYDTNPENNQAEASVELECVIPVIINIKPGSDPNSINPGSKGVIPIAILSTVAGEYGMLVDFNATMIDPLSVRFGLYDDVWNETGGAFEAHGRGHIEDSIELDEVTMDGDMDMVLHFRTQETGVYDGVVQLCVKGLWVDMGGSVHKFFGCGTIRTVPP